MTDWLDSEVAAPLIERIVASFKQIRQRAGTVIFDDDAEHMARAALRVMLNTCEGETPPAWMLESGMWEQEYRDGDDGAGTMWVDKDGKHHSTYQPPSKIPTGRYRWVGVPRDVNNETRDDAANT